MQDADPKLNLELTAASPVRTWSESSVGRPRPSESPIQKAAGFNLPGEVHNAIHQAAIGLDVALIRIIVADDAHRASLGPKDPPQWGLQYSLLACPCAGLFAASADVPAIGTAVHLDLEPTCRPSAMVADRSLSSGFAACHLTVMVLALLRSWDRSLNERSPAA